MHLSILYFVHSEYNTYESINQIPLGYIDKFMSFSRDDTHNLFTNCKQISDMYG